MPSTSAVLEENNAGTKAQKGKRLSWRLSINRQINSLFPHRAEQNQCTTSDTQAVLHHEGRGKELD